VKSSSPLRYPGGKSAMADLLGRIRYINGLGDRAMAEPFAGGAGASLSLLYREEAPEIHINDADPAIHALWWTLKYQPEQFAALLRSTRVSMAEWRRQRDKYRSKKRISRLERGFAAFYLNRCNHSGIIKDGGPIGGIKQTGKWLLDARFNKTNLLARCQKIADYKDRIFVTRQDGIELIKGISDRTFLFIDPPYFAKGRELYLNALDTPYHERLAATLKEREQEAWVLTYDDCPEIRRLYRGWATIRPFGLRYAASVRRSGREILIVPKRLKLPASQISDAITW
jgi:DNA adenine methylase